MGLYFLRIHNVASRKQNCAGIIPVGDRKHGLRTGQLQALAHTCVSGKPQANSWERQKKMLTFTKRLKLRKKWEYIKNKITRNFSTRSATASITFLNFIYSYCNWMYCLVRSHGKRDRNLWINTMVRFALCLLSSGNKPSAMYIFVWRVHTFFLLMLTCQLFTIPYIELCAGIT